MDPRAHVFAVAAVWLVCCCVGVLGNDEETKLAERNQMYSAHSKYMDDKKFQNMMSKWLGVQPKTRDVTSDSAGSAPLQRSSEEDPFFSNVLQEPLRRATNENEQSKTRLARANTVLNADSDSITLPWETKCSSAYKLCDGYFPECCDGLVCYKPITEWDKQNGAKRCWPSALVDAAGNC